MKNEEATALLDGLMKTYGINGSTYSCFSHKSEHSDLTVLAIKKYPQAVLMQLMLWLSLSLFILIACTMNTCRKTQDQLGRKTFKSGYRYRKSSSKVLNFHWKWTHENASSEIKEDDDYKM